MNITGSFSGLERGFPIEPYPSGSRFTSGSFGNDSSDDSLSQRVTTQAITGRFTSPILQIDVWDQRSANPTGRRLPLFFKRVSLAPSLRRRLLELRRLGRGWDGEEADPVRPEGVQAAEELLWAFSMARGTFREPSIIPKYDGFLQLEWHDGTRSLEFEFTADGWLVMGTDESAGARQYYEAHPRLGVPEGLILFYRWFVREEWLWPSL